MRAPRPQVHSVAVELTAVCNQRCRYCYNPQRTDHAAEDDVDGRAASDGAGGGGRAANDGTGVDAEAPSLIATRLGKLLDAWSIDHVTLTGGEPFAQRELWSVLDLLRKRGVRAQLISNGGLIDDEAAERLAPYQVRYVQITLNGPDAALHAEHTGDEAHFERAIAGVQALQRQAIPVVGCMVVTHRNADHVASTLELWRSLGVEHVALSRFSPAGQAVEHASRLLPTRQDMVEAFEQAQPLARDGMQVTCTVPIPPCMIEVSDYAPVRFGCCAIGTTKQEFALGADGRLRNCTLHGQPLGSDDILHGADGLAELIEAPEVAGYRDGLPEFCQGCLHAATCGGGCGAAADWMLGRGPRRMPDPFLWQHIDDALARRLGRPID